jgi:uncharacterized membrane-anchored protein
MKNKIIFLTIPFLILLIYILFRTIEYVYFSQQETYYFRIEGYDPRDLIKGNYLLYRIRYNDEYFVCNTNKEIKCGCIHQDSIDKKYKISKILPPLMECNDIKKLCNRFIQLECDKNYYIIPHQRYYIPEDFSNAVNKIPFDKSYVGLRIDLQGKSQIEEIYILEDKFIPLIEYLKAHP